MDPNKKIDDVIYPVQPVWAFKSTIISLVTLPLIAVYFYLRAPSSLIFSVVFMIIFSQLTAIHFIANLLRVRNFHFTFSADYLVFKQGVITKKERQIPYGVIQNITVSQDILDKMFGIANLKIENASQGGSLVGSRVNNQQSKTEANAIGFLGNAVIIPGLAHQNCVYLKQLLERELTTHQTISSGSGL